MISYQYVSESVRVIETPDDFFPRVEGDDLGNLVLRLWQSSLGENVGWAIFESKTDPSAFVTLRLRLKPGDAAPHLVHTITHRANVPRAVLEPSILPLLENDFPEAELPSTAGIMLDGLSRGLSRGKKSVTWSGGFLQEGWRWVDDSYDQFVSILQRLHS